MWNIMSYVYTYIWATVKHLHPLKLSKHIMNIQLQKERRICTIEIFKAPSWKKFYMKRVLEAGASRKKLCFLMYKLHTQVTVYKF